MNHFELKGGELACEDVALGRIAAAVGTPVYVYSTATLERHYRVFEAALATYPQLGAPRIAYAVKANSNLAVLATVAQTERFAPGYELIIMQHTDCGLSHLSPETHADVLASFLGVTPAEVAAKHLGDPREAVRSDIAHLRDNPLVPDTLVTSGLVYDVDTGHVDTIVAPATSD